MIRRAKVSDIESINKLLYQVHDVHAKKRNDIFKIGEKKYNDSDLVDIINDDNKPIFVYIEDDVLKGYAFCITKIQEENHSLNYRKVCYIDDLCVDENYRRLGIGTKLYNYVLDYAKNNNYTSVELNVWYCNNEALKFYESLDLYPLKTTLEHIIK